jgi:hypothetical protein
MERAVAPLKRSCVDSAVGAAKRELHCHPLARSDSFPAPACAALDPNCTSPGPIRNLQIYFSY